MRYISLIILALVALGGSAQVRFHNEATDTTFINDLLVEVGAMRLPTAAAYAAEFAKRFQDVPYVAHTLEGEPEELVVNVSELDCTTFVETVMALAITASERRLSWRDFVYNLRRIRYTNGRVDGYPSRLHYNSAWAVDNIHRGIIIDATTRFPRYSYITKTIDFMSANADKYAALADSANLARIKSMELGFRNHRFPYIKTNDTGNKYVAAEFRDGDILAFTSKINNLDVAHMGMIVMVDGEPRVIHASMSAGKVLITDKPIGDFLGRNRNFTGVRVFRLNND